MSDTSPGSSLQRMAEAKLGELEQRDQRRTLVISDRCGDTTLTRAGRPVSSFCCNDYLNLSQNPDVVAAARDATQRYGAGAGSSRLITGNHSLLAALERRLADLKGTEDAIVFGSGYLANTGIIPALVGHDDMIIADELVHACLHAGAQLSSAPTHRVRHNDVAEIASLLADKRCEHRHCLILADGVYSMDGDLAPLPELAELAARYDAWLLVDDAHGLGVIGGGRGSTHAFEPAAPVELQMGTLSKAAGAYGGYLCCSRMVAELLRNRARTLVYSTALPPAAVGAALAALEIMASEPERCEKPLANATHFCRALGLRQPSSPIVPIVLGDEATTLTVSQRLFERGFLVTAIRPPTVPAGTARLRLTFTAEHGAPEIDRLAEAVGVLLDAEQISL